MASNFLYYAFHYIILRTLYSGARAAGVSPMVLVGFAVLGLVVLHFTRRNYIARRKV